MAEGSLRDGWVGALVLGGGLLLVGGLIVVRCGLTLHVAHDTLHWPATQGVVTQAEFIPGSHGMVPRTSRLEYRYSIGVTDYTGDRVSWADTREAGWSRYTAGQSVPVYFNPEQPEQSVLQTGTDRWTHVQLGIGVVLALAGLGVLLLPLFLPCTSDASAR